MPLKIELGAIATCELIQIFNSAAMYFASACTHIMFMYTLQQIGVTCTVSCHVSLLQTDV
jgi:hypothetical protein